jgi:hypothetical protein
LRESAFFRNSISSQHGAEGFYCKQQHRQSSRSLLLNKPPLFSRSFSAVLAGMHSSRTLSSAGAVDVFKLVCSGCCSDCVSVWHSAIVCPPATCEIYSLTP